MSSESRLCSNGPGGPGGKTANAVYEVRAIVVDVYARRVDIPVCCNHQSVAASGQYRNRLDCIPIIVCRSARTPFLSSTSVTARPKLHVSIVDLPSFHEHLNVSLLLTITCNPFTRLSPNPNDRLKLLSSPPSFTGTVREYR